MPSLIQGYAHDIFVSYRHNDNRSGWVTEFVNALQEELAATIKEPLSIYFDKNPHDGLLETHNVDKSLEGKLKCLIFIPIISQTYCDPKSFAWQHEFVVFNALSQVDQFGKTARLASGNVASRILPIMIHTIDDTDRKLFEETTNEVMRSIEFIYKSAGVNRPLRGEDDQINESGKKLYRDQVNKVANSIKDLLFAITNYARIKDGSMPTPNFSTTSSITTNSKWEADSNKKTKRSVSVPVLVIALIISITAGLAVAWLSFSKNDQTNEVTTHSSILPPDGVFIQLIGEAGLGTGRRAIDISRAGDKVAFIGNHKGRPHIYIRSIRDFEAKVIPGTEGAFACRLSPDGREVAFFVGNTLQKIKIEGGSAITLAEAANPMDIIWETSNSLYFSANEGATLYRYSNKLELVKSGDQFKTLSWAGDFEHLLISGENKLAIFDLKSRSSTVLDLVGEDARYISPGHLVFARGSTLMSVSIDPTGFKIIGEPREVLSGVRIEGYGNGQFACSQEGTFIYIKGEDTRIGGFTWAYRNGTFETMPFPKEDYGTFKLSPDQTKIAAPVNGTSNDIWLYDLASGKKVRLTNGGVNGRPVWQNDSSIFIRKEKGIYQINLNQNNKSELILEQAMPQSISADGNLLIIIRQGGIYKYDLQKKELTQLTKPTDKNVYHHGSISPDGSLFAYTLNDTKSFHVYLQKTNPEGKAVQISVNEGSEEPRWTADGKKIIYRSGQQWMEVRMINPKTLEVSAPKLIVEGDYVNIGGFSFDISKDGEKLLFVKGTEEKSANEIRMIKGWSNKIKEDF